MTTKPSSGKLIRGRGKQKLLYRQLADQLRSEIESGALKPGAMLPSMDDLASQYDINKATVRQAITSLITAGLVYSVPARGTFVCEEKPSNRVDPSRRLSIGWALRVNDEGKTGRYHTEIMDAVQTALEDIRGHLLIMSVFGMPAPSFCRLVGEADLDGIILIGYYEPQTIRHLANSGLPTVLIDDTCRGAKVDSILIDNRGGGFHATQHLLSLGHRRLAFVTGPSFLQITKDRLAGAFDAIEEAGITKPSVRILEGDFRVEGGYEAMRKLIAMKPRPTGVFFFNDEMASGALQALHEFSDLKVPKDVSLVGFDDVSWAGMANPPLTSVHVEMEMIGREAVERLRRKLENPARVATTTIVPTRLVVRKSTAPPIQREA